MSNFRHHLTPRLERFGGQVGYSVRPSDRRQGHATRWLDRAKDLGRGLGLGRLLLTCEPANLGSVRVIEKNGGIEEDEGCRIRRYRIEL